MIKDINISEQKGKTKMKCDKIYLWCAVLILVGVVKSEEDVETKSEEIVENTSKFKSVPTTVKTFENETVVLPCYLENAGKTIILFFFRKYVPTISLYVY